MEGDKPAGSSSPRACSEADQAVEEASLREAGLAEAAAGVEARRSHEGQA